MFIALPTPVDSAVFTNVETKAGERDVCARDGGGDRGWQRRHACPSLLEIARFESGDLNDLQGASMNAHTRTCFRCRSALADIRQARGEILGPTAEAHGAQSQRAALAIETILERHVH